MSKLHNGLDAIVRYSVGLYHGPDGEGWGLWRTVRHGKRPQPVSETLVATFENGDDAALFLRFCDQGLRVEALPANRTALGMDLFDE